jgi:hypothetical protein
MLVFARSIDLKNKYNFEHGTSSTLTGKFLSYAQHQWRPAMTHIERKEFVIFAEVVGCMVWIRN